MDTGTEREARPGPPCGGLVIPARGTRGPNIIDPHRACRQASGRVGSIARAAGVC